MKHELWYREPARHWEEALPLGNGRLGVMEFGGGRETRLALNEDTLWSGYPKVTDRMGAADYYPQAGDLALSGKLHEAEALIEERLNGAFTQSYLPLGDLILRHPCEGEAERLVRRLSLDQAVHKTVYTLGGVTYTRTTFVSHPAQAVFVRVEADRPGALTLELSLRTALRGRIEALDGRIVMDGLAPSNVVPSYLRCDDPVTYDEAPERRGMRVRAVLAVKAEGGAVDADGGRLRVEGADAAELRLVARTSFNGYDRQPFTEGRDEKQLCVGDLAVLEDLSWDDALAAHIADHRALYDRVTLELEGGDYDDVPTDERLRAAREDDNGLCALLFHYGRYLLIASSRPGTQAANLQGIWNQDLRAIWSSNYTININTHMNYWAAEQVNLPELCEPLFDLIRGLCDRGRATARVHYGARGAVAHHNTDIWRLTNPVGEQHRGFAGCGFWPMSLGWLCRHLTEHDRYHRDDAFLRDRALPALKLAARFYLDVAVEDRDGFLTLAPATSPENQFIYEGKHCKVAARAAMTTAILREVFESYLAVLRRLDLSEPMAGEAEAALKKLAPAQTGSKGQLLEWEREYEEPEPEHRHISHLYALYPGNGADEALKAAAQRSLEGRGDGGTGWSLAWKTAAWARLGDGDHALKMLRTQLTLVEAGTACKFNRGGSYISLLDAHPPFQIDGNFGSTAAIAQMLAQDRDGVILLLPALPGAWRSGRVAGLRAPGDVTLDFSFENGRVTQLRVRNEGDAAARVLVNGAVVSAPVGESQFEC